MGASRSEVEAAYADFVGKLHDEKYYRIKPEDENRFLREGEATHQQMLDVLVGLLDRPISSWMIFKAGWDYARKLSQGVGHEEGEGNPCSQEDHHG